MAPNLRISNGITSFLIGNYDYLKANGYHIDFLLIKKVESPYNQIVEKNRSNIFIYPNYNNKYSFNNYRFVTKIFEENQYEIVHVNTTGMYAYWALLAADKAKVPIRIYHSHNPKETNSIKGIVREKVFNRLCFLHTTDYMACTKHAGDSVFEKREFSVVRNGIDFSKFWFDEISRFDIRTKLQIEDKIVVGTVCRQADQKNPYFIVDILVKLNKLSKKYVLIWVGSGPLLENVKSYTEKKGISENILFLGDRDDVNKIYSAMDCFLLPSKYEGLGIVFLEAQASGLPCFASVAVPKDTDISGKIYYYDLNDNVEEWAERIHTKQSIESNRVDIQSRLKFNESSISVTNRKLLSEYEAMLERNTRKWQYI